LEATIPATATTDASDAAAISESPGFLAELHHLLQATAEPAAAPAAPAPAAVMSLVPIFLNDNLHVHQHQHQHQHQTVPTTFDDSLLLDPAVTELAARLLLDKEAFANAERLVQASCQAKASTLATTRPRAGGRKVGGGGAAGAAGAPKRKRKAKQDVPEHEKDAAYWRRRHANTGAARRTRERAKLQKTLRDAAAAQASAAKAKLNVLMKYPAPITTAY